RGGGQGPDSGGKGEALRAFRARSANDPSGTQSPTAHCDPERILVVVEEIRRGSVTCARGTRNWLCTIQSVRQRLSHGKDERKHDLRQFGFSEPAPTFYAGGPEGESGVG